MSTVINLTPHVINEVNTGMSIPASGIVARVCSNSVQIGEVNGAPVNSVTFGEVENLPTIQPDTFYIVSGLVLSAVSGRTDLIAPAELVRDTSGNPIGCNGFRQ